jgi:undecaprenyl-diphosphatase
MKTPTSTRKSVGRGRGPDWLSWLGQHQRGLLIALVVVTAGIWGFAVLGNAVTAGRTLSFDEQLLLALRDPHDAMELRGPPWLQELGRDVTALGGVGVLTFLTLAIAGFLMLQGKYRAAGLLVLAISGGQLLSTLLKFWYDRPRPDLVPHGSIVYSASFPSGHSMMAAVTYLTLGALLARLQPGRRIKAYLLSLAIVLTVAVGVSRVYLGVHWPTDVLAGWTVGAMWALLCWLAAQRLQRRRQIERDVE